MKLLKNFLNQSERTLYICQALCNEFHAGKISQSEYFRSSRVLKDKIRKLRQTNLDIIDYSTAEISKLLRFLYDIDKIMSEELGLQQDTVSRLIMREDELRNEKNLIELMDDSRYIRHLKNQLDAQRYVKRFNMESFGSIDPLLGNINNNFQ